MEYDGFVIVDPTVFVLFRVVGEIEKMLNPPQLR